MTVYAITITLALGFIAGVIAHAAYEAWLDGRAIAKARRQADRERKARAAFQADVERGTDEDMERAVDVVQTHADGELITP